MQDTFAPVSQLQFVDKANCIFVNEPHTLRGLSILAMMAWFIVEFSPLEASDHRLTSL